MPPKSEQPEYPYQNIRTKNYFWGDGDKVSRGRITWPGHIANDYPLQTIFWNDKVNYHKKSDE
jgi:cytochrome c oxidase subunit 6a